MATVATAPAGGTSYAVTPRRPVGDYPYHEAHDATYLQRNMSMKRNEIPCAIEALAWPVGYQGLDEP